MWIVLVLAVTSSDKRASAVRTDAVAEISRHGSRPCGRQWNASRGRDPAVCDAVAMADESLLRELAELRADLQQLRAQLDAARLHHAPTMRARTRCPACGNARIAHAHQVLDRGDGDAQNPMALNRPSWWSGKLVGELEAFACTACGLVEWYVKDPGGLREVKGLLTILDGETPDAGPYR